MTYKLAIAQNNIVLKYTPNSQQVVFYYILSVHNVFNAQPI